MTPPGRGEFSYRDKKLGDVDAITVGTAPDVFYPTSTTLLRARAARRVLAARRAPAAVLDLGCGCGIVGVVLAQLAPAAVEVCASDLSAGAVRLARHNAGRAGVRIDCRRGSLFEPWAGRRFDLIVDDVAGVAEPLARRWGGTRGRCRARRGRTGRAGSSGCWIARRISSAPGAGSCFPRSRWRARRPCSSAPASPAGWCWATRIFAAYRP